MRDAITVKDLYKRYPKTTALKGISFKIKKGDFFGLLGPNGAGKTTTIQILTGLANKTTGDVKLFDNDVVKDYRKARELIGLVPQEFNMDMFEKVYNIMFFNAGYFGIPEKERLPKIKKILESLDLWEKRDSKARELSGGMKRKLMIARALIHNPKILILDEPTAGVDVVTRRQMWKYFEELNKKGTTILLTTHYIEEAEMLCNTIGVINHGEIIKLEKKSKLMHILGGERAIIEVDKPIKSVPKELKKYNAKIENGNKICVPFKADVNAWNNLLKDLQSTGLPIVAIETERKKLEDIFVELTEK